MGCGILVLLCLCPLSDLAPLAVMPQMLKLQMDQLIKSNVAVEKRAQMSFAVAFSV